MIDKQTLGLYRKARGAGDRMQTANHALHEARTKRAWDMAGGDFVGPNDYRDDPESDDPKVRIAILPDDSADLSWLDETGKRDKVQLERAKRDGCWGMVGQFWNGTEWENADSIWGFIGDDFRNSGYDTDIMHATLKAYNESLEQAARDLEATRPDMYPQG